MSYLTEENLFGAALGWMLLSVVVALVWHVVSSDMRHQYCRGTFHWWEETNHDAPTSLPADKWVCGNCIAATLSFAIILFWVLIVKG